MDYVQEFEYSMFLMDKMEEQAAMEHFVQECYILSEETMTLADLKALNEATGIGQRIKDLWAKFMKFLRTVWDKFVHVMDQLVLKDQEYLKKHEKTIKNKPVQLASVDMQNYDEGVKRISSVNHPQLKPDMLDDEKLLASKANFIDSLNLAGITGKDEEIFTSKCKNFFLGGEKTLTIPGNTLNMTDLYDYCYDYKTVTSKVLANNKKSFEDNMNIINNKINSLERDEKAAEAQAKAAEQKQKNDQAREKAEAERQKAADGAEAVKNFANQKKEESKEESARFDIFGREMVLSEVNNQYITELKINKTPSNSSSQANTQAPSNPENDNKKLSNSIARVSVDADKVDARALNKSQTAEEQKELLTKLSVYKDVCGTMFTSKMTAAEQIYKDYMKIIEAHVNSYAGDNGETKETTAKDGTDYRNELKKIIDKNETAIRNYVKNLDPNNNADVEKFQNWFSGIISSEGYKGEVALDFKGFMAAAKG